MPLKITDKTSKIILYLDQNLNFHRSKCCGPAYINNFGTAYYTNGYCHGQDRTIQPKYAEEETRYHQMTISPTFLSSTIEAKYKTRSRYKRRWRA